MSYGIIARNNNNEVVIQDQTPIYVLKRSGTLNSSFFSSFANSHGFFVNNTPAAPLGTEEVFFSVPVGGWVSFYPWITFATDGQQQFFSDLNTTELAASMSQVQYFVFDKLDVVGAATSGYGAQVFNQNGVAVWDSTKVTNRVSFGATILTNSTNSQSVTVNSDANAVSLRAWECHLNAVGSPGTAIRSWAARRTSGSQWAIEKRIVDRGYFRNGTFLQFNAVVTVGDARYLLGYTS
jgi:hypothetical protein